MEDVSGVERESGCWAGERGDAGRVVWVVIRSRDDTRRERTAYARLVGLFAH